jgi:TonB family protein
MKLKTRKALTISLAVFLLSGPALRAQEQDRPKPAPPRLLAELKSNEVTSRRQAAMQLGELRARDAIRPLAQGLLDRDASVREASAFALGQITDRQAIEPLLGALSDKDEEVQASAAFALGMLDDRRAIRALSNALGNSSVAVRSSAAVALGLIQDHDSLDEIVAMLDDPSIDVRYDAVWSLGQIGAYDAIGHLHAALVNLDLLKIDDKLLEAYRQAVQHSIERLQALDDTKAGRPRRANTPQGEKLKDQAHVSRPMNISQTVQAAPTERAIRARVNGSVKLRVLVGVEGRAVRAYVARRLGYGLDQRAVQAVLQYRFDPEIKSGLPQTIWVDLDVKY